MLPLIRVFVSSVWFGDLGFSLERDFLEGKLGISLILCWNRHSWSCFAEIQRLSAFFTSCEFRTRILPTQNLLLYFKRPNSYQEYTKLKARVEVLQQSQRHILGEDLGQLNIKELEQLERQLDSSLRQIRSRRTQNMLDQLSDLQQKEQSLLEINRSLKIKLDENYVAYQTHWDTGEQNIQFRHQPAQAQEFFQPLQCNNTMPNRYNQAPWDNIEPSTQNATGVLPGWML